MTSPYKEYKPARELHGRTAHDSLEMPAKHMTLSSATNAISAFMAKYPSYQERVAKPCHRQGLERLLHAEMPRVHRSRFAGRPPMLAPKFVFDAVPETRAACGTR